MEIPMQKIEILESYLALPHGSLRGDTSLLDVPAWDSLAMLGFIGEFSCTGAPVDMIALSSCKTVQELCRLIP